jgi:cytochrome oxidase Cu insertion factor (SCO1/SenC/PrrC family)
MKTFVIVVIMLVQTSGQHSHSPETRSSARVSDQELSMATDRAGREVTIDGRRLVIPDVLLRDQSGKKVRFYTDLLKGKSFVLGFFFTDCT